jgi:hypothetical protein
MSAAIRRRAARACPRRTAARGPCDVISAARPAPFSASVLPPVFGPVITEQVELGAEAQVERHDLGSSWPRRCSSSNSGWRKARSTRRGAFVRGRHARHAALHGARVDARRRAPARARPRARPHSSSPRAAQHRCA